jgi:hypothetical protein
VDGTDQPAEFDFGHDRADALERLVGRRLVIQGQKRSGDYLNHKQEERHPSQEVKDAGPMDRHALLGSQVLKVVEA